MLPGFFAYDLLQGLMVLSQSEFREDILSFLSTATISSESMLLHFEDVPAELTDIEEGYTESAASKRSVGVFLHEPVTLRIGGPNVIAFALVAAFGEPYVDKESGKRVVLLRSLPVFLGSIVGFGSGEYFMISGGYEVEKSRFTDLLSSSEFKEKVFSLYYQTVILDLADHIRKTDHSYSRNADYRILLHILQNGNLRSFEDRKAAHGIIGKYMDDPGFLGSLEQSSVPTASIVFLCASAFALIAFIFSVSYLWLTREPA
jgi:hypothetical protein